MFPYHLTHLTASCILVPWCLRTLEFASPASGCVWMFSSVVICLISCPCCWLTLEAGAPTQSACSLGQGKFRQQQHQAQATTPQSGLTPHYPGNKLHPGSLVHRLLPNSFLGRYSLSWHPTSSQFTLEAPIPLLNFASCLHLCPGTHLSVPAHLGLWPVFPFSSPQGQDGAWLMDGPH